MNIKENKELNTLNHSCAHLLAHAVKRLYPEALLWVGPVIAEGFYYDIDMQGKTIAEEDLDKISKEMKKIAKSDKLIKRMELSKEEALEMFKDNPYKIELINEIPDGEIISAYKQDEFIDLCRGPHVKSTKLLKHFKLLKVSGAYYKGDSKNKVMQRIYGVCFENEEDLNAHMHMLEEAKERDHRKINKDLNIFMTDDLVGRGLPIYLPNGYIIWEELENYIKKKERHLGYKHVKTPSLGNVELYKTSGHWDHYKDDMFPEMEIENEKFVLRPMNCPHHMMIYKNELHSYRDLPIKIGEIAPDFRYESSGSLKGIERVRHFCQNDAHLFVTLDQVKDAFKETVDLILEVYKDFDITDYRFELSLRDKEDKIKYYQDDEMWDKAENMLRSVLKDLNIEYTEMIGEAAFYGPKLDVQIKPAVGTQQTLSTCQLDFCLPQKFDLTYVDKDGSKKTPVVVHRAILGSIDRFMAYIIEETKGVLPLWLSPVQVNIIPVNNEYHLDYSKELYNLLLDSDIRVEIDSREEKLGYRIRESVMHKVPYALIIGDSEKDNNVISYRPYGTNDTITVSKEEFMDFLKDRIDSKK